MKSRYSFDSEPTTELTIVQHEGRWFRLMYTGGKPDATLLGGHQLARASAPMREGHYDIVHLQFHGGRGCWMVEHERVHPGTVLPRDDAWGTLPEMMALFEKKTGLALPAVKVTDVRRGVYTCRAGTEAVVGWTPYMIQAGERYSFIGHGQPRTAVAVEGPNGSVELRDEKNPILQETYPPSIMFGGPAGWLTLKKLPSLSEEALPRDRVAAILAAQDEACSPSSVGYYPSVDALAQRAAGIRAWAMGEVFVWAQGPEDFVILKQVAPDSCEMLVLTQHGYHDVVSAHSLGAQDFARDLERYRSGWKPLEEPLDSPAC